MDCCPGAGVSVGTSVILVVPASVGFPTGASVPVVLLGTGAAEVCSVAASGDAAEPPLLSAVAAGVVIFGWLGVAAEGVATFFKVGGASGAAGLFVTVGACG